MSSSLRWEVSITEFTSLKNVVYKVTRAIPNLLISETKIFDNKHDAYEQMEEWLKDM